MGGLDVKEGSVIAKRAMEDIRRTLRENKHYQRKEQPVVDANRGELVIEINKLKSVIQVLSLAYQELAKNYIQDPFGSEYEQVLSNLEWARRVINNRYENGSQMEQNIKGPSTTIDLSNNSGGVQYDH